MGIPEVIQRTVFQQIAVQFIRMVSVLQSCPLVEFPTHAPAGSAVSAMFQYHFGCLCKFGGSHGRDGMSRMQSEQVVDVPVFIFRIVYVGRPFQELAVASYAVRNEFGQYVFPLLALFGVRSEYLACLDSVQ